MLGQVALEKVGVGDVFVSAGQPNSVNCGQVRQTAKDDRVVYCDGKAYTPARDPIAGGFGGRAVQGEMAKAKGLTDRARNASMGSSQRSPCAWGAYSLAVSLPR